MKNPSKKFLLLNRAVQNLGFDGVLYSFFPKSMYINEQTQPLMHYSDNFETFVTHYLEKKYGNNDFVIRLIAEKNYQMVDWWQEINNQNVSKKESEVTLDAKNNFNIQNGLTICLLNGTFAMAAISVISFNSNPKYFQNLKNKNIDKLQILAKNYHINILSSNDRLGYFIEPLFSNLNQTKKNVIKHLISGKPMKAIAQDYYITQRYAEKTLITIRNEFGNISTNELIYILGKYGIEENL